MYVFRHVLTKINGQTPGTSQIMQPATQEDDVDETLVKMLLGFKFSKSLSQRGNPSQISLGPNLSTQSAKKCNKIFLQ
jgi:hypothetical protein